MTAEMSEGPVTQLRTFSKQGGCRDGAGDQSVATARGWGTQSLLGTRWLCLPVAGVPDETHSLPEMLPEEEEREGEVPCRFFVPTASLSLRPASGLTSQTPADGHWELQPSGEQGNLEDTQAPAAPRASPPHFYNH